MRPGDAQLAADLRQALDRFETRLGALPGVAGTSERSTFIEQLVESQRRRAFVQRLSGMELDPRRADPSSALLFDPLKAAAFLQRDGAVDEAFWMAFLSVHFGKSPRGGWRYARDVYGRLGAGRWDWAAVTRDPPGFRAWIEAEADRIHDRGAGGFGNHRKYQRLARTGLTVETYARWVGGSHPDRFAALAAAAGGDPRTTFATAYRSMEPVAGFGRTARFDYLTTVGRLGLFALEPDRAYLVGATGPLDGARLLFGLNVPARSLDDRLLAFGAELGLTMDVVEDAVCNWQKSPAAFTPFRG